MSVRCGHAPVSRNTHRQRNCLGLGGKGSRIVITENLKGNLGEPQLRGFCIFHTGQKWSNSSAFSSGERPSSLPDVSSALVKLMILARAYKKNKRKKRQEHTCEPQRNVLQWRGSTSGLASSPARGSLSPRAHRP